MFSLLISLLLFFTVTVQLAKAQSVEESTPSAQIIEITPTLTSVPTVLGTSVSKKKFNFKWLILFLPIIPLYISIRKYNNSKKQK